MRSSAGLFILIMSLLIAAAATADAPALPSEPGPKAAAMDQKAAKTKKNKRDKKNKKQGRQEEEANASADEEKWNVSEPPGEWTSVLIDTEETTWTNLDVSPDGTTVVFDMLGDIYTVPIGGGEASALTDGIEWNMEPTFSPDGTRIAFISDRQGADNLWVMKADGSDPKAVSQEREHLVHNPAWSPDGQFLAAKKNFTSSRSIPAGEIWLFHAGGGGGLQLIERPHGPQSQKNIAEPAFSPDGRYVYFSQDTTPGVVWQYAKDPTGQIFTIRRLDRETGEVETYVAGPGGAIRPVPSPDGRYLAFVKRLPTYKSSLYLKDLTNGQEWSLYDELDRDLQETDGSEGNTPAFAWTPDSASIVFWAAGKIRRVDVESRKSQVIPVRVRAEKKVHTALRFPVEVSPESFPVRMLRWVRKSPSEDKVVFQALGHLYTRSTTEDATPRRLTRQDDHYEFYPSFSRDGRWIVYTTWDDQDLGSIRVIPAGGGESRTVSSEPGIYVEPRFSPDGRQIVYRKLTGGFLLSAEWSIEPGIFVVPTDGGEARHVTSSGVNPHFGDDAERIFFTTLEDTSFGVLKSVDPEGREERTHLKGNYVTEYSVSPDGRWVAFLEQRNAYVMPMARTGKTIDVGPKSTAIPVRQVSSRSGENFHWSADSDALHWAHGATFYTRELKDAFNFLDGAPEELPEPVAEGLDLGFTTPSDKPEGTIALVGARVVTMRGAKTVAKENTANENPLREVIEDGVVVVEGDRIAAVGRRSEVEVPDGAKVFDVTGKTIVPGFVDVHAHGGMANTEITPQQNWQQVSNLAFGVTTIHDPSNDSTEIFAAAELQRAGLLLAPRIYSTGSILYGAQNPSVKARIESYNDALFHVRRLKEMGAISVKSYQQPRRDQRQQVIAAGRELGIMVVPEGGAKFQHNLNEIVDGHTGIEHSLSVADAYDDVRQLWSATEVGFTPTIGVAYGGLSGEIYWYDRTEVWKNERLMRYTPRRFVEPRAMRRTTAPDEHYNHFHVVKLAKALSERGVSVQTGAHGQREGLATHWEMWMLEQGGFTPWEAIRAATIDGAWYVGLDGDVGSIEPGKLADLVVIDGNPLEDLRRSEYVVYTMLGGRLYEAATMSQLAPEKVALEEFFFQKEGGDTIHPATQRRIEEFALRHGWVH